MQPKLNSAAYRKSLISRIHIARTQLGMDEDTYRGALQSAIGKTSCSTMSIPELMQALEAMVRLGFKPKANKRKSRGVPHNFASASMPEMITKVGALLADMKLSWAYADGIAKRMFGIEKCAWVREPAQLKAIIAALYNKQQKAKTEGGGNE